MVAFRDRFFTARTAKALLSWRILVGIAVGVGVNLVLGYPEAILLGLVVYGLLVYRAIEQTWAIARRGDDIDAAVNRIDPTRLRSRLETLRTQPGAGSGEAIASVESQLQSADRLKALSADTADKLRL